MEIVIGIVLASIFTFLGGLHLYWAAGGQVWIKGAAPEIEGKGDFSPGVLATLFVAGALFALGILSFTMGFHLSEMAWLGWSGWSAAGLFFIRAVGDFKYVGFFKKLKSGLFAKRDRQIYAPLCLGISFLFSILSWNFA